MDGDTIISDNQATLDALLNVEKRVFNLNF